MCGTNYLHELIVRLSSSIKTRVDSSLIEEKQVMVVIDNKLRLWWTTSWGCGWRKDTMCWWTIAEKVWRNMNIMSWWRSKAWAWWLINKVYCVGWSEWESEYTKDVGNKVVSYGVMVKGKQGSTTMDRARVKGKQEAWHRDQITSEQWLKASNWWTIKIILKLWVIWINFMKNERRYSESKWYASHGEGHHVSWRNENEGPSCADESQMMWWCVRRLKWAIYMLKNIMCPKETMVMEIICIWASSKTQVDLRWWWT
jgi:hypothetical protein